MASPPFTLNLTVPGDTDIVSQFPGVDRTHIDILNSWLLTNHNTQGRHKQVDIDIVGTANGIGSAPSPVAHVLSIFADSDGALKFVRGDDSTTEFLGVPPGSMFFYGGTSIPTGFILGYGQAISRTTYARLFSAYGTRYGAGDGSTTFNVPDVRGRFPAGLDNMGGVSAGRMFTVSPVLGNTGGSVNSTIVLANLPPLTSTNSGISVASAIIPCTSTGTGGIVPGVTSVLSCGNVGGSNLTLNAQSVNQGISTGGGGGSTVPLDITNPMIFLNLIIKY